MTLDMSRIDMSQSNHEDIRTLDWRSTSSGQGRTTRGGRVGGGGRRVLESRTHGSTANGTTAGIHDISKCFGLWKTT